MHGGTESLERNFEGYRAYVQRLWYHKLRWPCKISNPAGAVCLNPVGSLRQEPRLSVHPFHAPTKKHQGIGPHDCLHKAAESITHTAATPISFCLLAWSTHLPTTPCLHAESNFLGIAVIMYIRIMLPGNAWKRGLLTLTSHITIHNGFGYCVGQHSE